jgi:glycosyltransferase involved in cell wall biosynthesis
MVSRRICIVLPSLAGGGTEKVRLLLADFLSKKGWTVDFLLFSAQGENFEYASSVYRIFVLPHSRFRRSFCSVRKFFSNQRYDVVLIALWPLTFILPLVLFLTGNRTRIIVSEHADLEMEYCGKSVFRTFLIRTTLFLAYRLSHARLTVSRELGARLAKLSLMPTSSFDCVPNPYRPQQYSDGEIKSYLCPWGDDFKGIRVLAVGSLKEQKNFAMLIEAISLLPDLNIKLAIAGDGPQLLLLSELVTKLGLAGRVVLLGYRKDVDRILARTEVFVLSSKFEGFPNVLIEALMAGVKILSTDCNYGPREILANGLRGDLVRTNSAEVFADALRQTIQNEGRQVDFEVIKSEFDFETAMERYENIINRVMERYGP